MSENTTVVARDVGFVPLQHKIPLQPNYPIEMILSVLESSVQKLEQIEFTMKSKVMTLPIGLP